ncbi:MAG: rRNA (adenine1518-N6/adenine1519-N6)-dimethyltransferase [Actinomycetota bacterium]|nr:rRNA (adenine1518-N6/adenine1519-N6)-dimethyltransferase [Actinomycetota bacterium]
MLGARRVGELLAKHGVRPNKALGQNFVIDPNTIRKVVETARLEPGDTVLEIGPGVGSLTRGLAGSAMRVIAVEIDERLIPVLQEGTSDLPNVEIVLGDALKADLGSFGATKLVANLPYNVAVPIVMRALETAPDITRLTVMAQREVGERLAASPGSKVYGAPSVLVRYYSEPLVVARIARNAFFPVPNVDSVLVELTRHEPPNVEGAAFFAVVRAAFGQRRKSIRNSLGSLLGPVADETIHAAGLDPSVRPEQLTLEGFVTLARLVSKE